jgi:acyl-CoA thioesterase-1
MREALRSLQLRSPATAPSAATAPALSRKRPRAAGQWLLAVGCGLFVLTGCGGGGSAGSAGGSAAAVAPVATPQPAATADTASAPQPAAPLVVFLGDSLSAGYGLAEEEAFPALLAARLTAAGRPIRVVNAGVSGDTSAGGRQRLDWLLRQQPDVLVVELGANDALRGQPLAATEENLRAIIQRAREAGVEVLLCGMQIPPNYGPEYTTGFAELFPRLARELEVELVPFLLAGVGGVPELNLPDGIHPTAEGHQRVAANVEPHLHAVLDRLAREG